MADHGADPYLVPFDAHVAEVGVQVVDVDEVLEVGQPEFHHGQQTVAARDQPCRPAQAAQQADRVVDAGRTFVLERCRDMHAPFLRVRRAARALVSPEVHTFGAQGDNGDLRGRSRHRGRKGAEVPFSGGGPSAPGSSPPA